MLGAIVELGAILDLVLTNGVLAGAEIAVVSSRESRLDRRAREGDGAARRALELLRSPDRFLLTVQVGITAVAVIGGALAPRAKSGAWSPSTMSWKASSERCPSLTR